MYTLVKLIGARFLYYISLNKKNIKIRDSYKIQFSTIIQSAKQQQFPYFTLYPKNKTLLISKSF